MVAGPSDAAFLLHKYDYKNSSLIAHFFCQEQGRVHALVRGVKTSKAGRQALLQPFMPLEVSFSGRGELKTVIQLEPRGTQLQFQQHSLLSAYYLNELLLRLLETDEPHFALFTAYENCVLNLAEKRPVAAQLRYFEYELLTALGYGLALTHESHSGEAVQANNFYFYNEEQGLVRAEGDGAGCYTGASLLALLNYQLDDDRSLRDAKHLLRQLLSPLLGDKPLKSREVYRQYLKNRSGIHESE